MDTLLQHSGQTNKMVAMLFITSRSFVRPSLSAVARHRSSSSFVVRRASVRPSVRPSVRRRPLSVITEVFQRHFRVEAAGILRPVFFALGVFCHDW